jgi:hypothetical protein
MPIHCEIYDSPSQSSSNIQEKLMQYGFHTKTLTVFNDLRHITLLYNHDGCKKVSESHQAFLDAQLLCIEHALVECQNGEISGGNQVQRSFCIACLIFISLFLREIPGPVLLNETLTTRLRENMEGIEQTRWTEAPPEIMLWMLFMGGLVAKGRSHRPWFVSRLSKREITLEFRDWDLVKESLKTVLWVHKIPEDSCKALCDEVVTFKL